MWKKLLRAGPKEWMVLAEAQLWLLWAAALVAFRPRGKLISARGSHSPPPPPRLERAETVDSIVTAIGRVTRRGLTRPACLVRSIALQRMLSFHRVAHVQVRFGVRMRAEEFESHAWVEWGGRVVGDDPEHVRSFTPLDDLSLISSAPEP